MKNTTSKILFFTALFQASNCFGGMNDISGMVLAPKKPSVFSFSKNSPVPSKKILDVSALDKKLDSNIEKKESPIRSVLSATLKEKSPKKVKVIGNMARTEGDIIEKTVYKKEVFGVAENTISEKLEEIANKKKDSFEEVISNSRKEQRAFSVNSEDALEDKSENASFTDVFSNMSKNKFKNEGDYDLSIDKLTKAPSNVKKIDTNAFISSETMNSNDLKKDLMNNYIAQNRYVSPLTLEDVDRESNKGFYKSISIKDRKNLEGGRLNILQMKLGFTENSSALNSRNINNLRNFAVTVLDNPNQGVKVGISTDSLKTQESKQMAARRYSIIHKILREEGVKERNIIPVLTARAEESFSLNIFDVDNFQTTKRTGGINIFGEEVDKRYYNTLSW